DFSLRNAFPLVSRALRAASYSIRASLTCTRTRRLPHVQHRRPALGGDHPHHAAVGKGLQDAPDALAVAVAKLLALRCTAGDVVDDMGHAPLAAREGGHQADDL